MDIYDSRNKKVLVGIEEVDTKLLKLSSMLDAKLVTNDYNLNKVAKIQEVDILNINELANTLKPVVIPGNHGSKAGSGRKGTKSGTRIP